MRISDWSSDVCSSDLSAEFDGLVTVDPHLHRYGNLQEIYSIETEALAASPLLAEWIRDHVEAPLIIGPDSESEQWAGAIAGHIGAPHVVFTKTRRGDRDVIIAAANLSAWKRSEEHTSELQSLMRISYAVFCLKKNTIHTHTP